MKTKLIVAAFFMVLLTGCWPDEPGYEFEYDTIVTEAPVNLEKINSEYDDYNSDLPYVYGSLPIIFSSNRISQGSQFDFVYSVIELSYHEKDDALNFAFPITYGNAYIDKLLPLVNTDDNQLGPLSYYQNPYEYFFYADDSNGNYNIKFVYTLRNDWGVYGSQQLIGPFDATVINSAADDSYPVFSSDSTIVFCSNRSSEVFNIYSIKQPEDMLLHSFLETSLNDEVEPMQNLSSEGNDKCPSINGDLMVFTSDRDGGNGGFDLYYSMFTNGQWSDPINFGSQVNSPYDEYRPITFDFAGFKVMIFSSNRPEGKGGFDLYAVIINTYIENNR